MNLKGHSQKKVWALQGGIILISAALLFVGNLWVTSLNHDSNNDGTVQEFRQNVNAQVIEIFSVETIDDPIGITTTTLFVAVLPEEDNREVVGMQQIFQHHGAIPPPSRHVQVGDRVLMQIHEGYNLFEVVGFLRIQYIAVLGVLVVVVVVAFGKIQGINSIVALALTIGSIFLVFVPAIVAGANIFWAAILVCLYSAVTTLLIVIGPNKKAFCTIIGCISSIAFVAITVLVMDTFMQMTGFLDSDMGALFIANPNISLTGIIFAGIVIGAFGAVMDVSMSISSALWEVCQAGNHSFKSLYKSGLTIGKDILGTMANTLILAYIGSSLSIILLIFHIHYHNIFAIFHEEMIIAELLRAFAGIVGIFLAIPITTLVCGWMYSTNNQETQEAQH
ncbi:MAG: YibE/F family protein [Defluviitaleaceae bacterium]|nr:YibE/F family protein [Defluviitaleaceae bacterium]